MDRAIDGLALAALACACASARPLPPRIDVTIANDLPVASCDVHLRPSAQAAAGWSTDWLDREQRVAPGMERTFAVAPGETWDIRLTACDGRVLSTRERLTLRASTRVPASAQPVTASSPLP
jgi:hypothetical protein